MPGPDEPPVKQVRTAAMLGRALLLRCPVCGTGGIFGRRMRLADRCHGCGFRFERIEGTWIGAVGLNTIVSFSVLFVVLLGSILLAWPDAPGWPALAGAVGVAVVLPVAFFPWSKTLWLVIDLKLRPLDTARETPGCGSGDATA